ncbi:MAG: hypothetical protein Q9187_001486 [Circinaria calcarea]
MKSHMRGFLLAGMMPEALFGKGNPFLMRPVLCSKASRRKGRMSVNLEKSRKLTLTNFDKEKRPVIFVAHSLGGLILQAFLLKCGSPLRASIKGIMFFGTPSFGFREKDWIEFAAAMSNIDYALGNKSTSYISGDRYMSQLGYISDSFNKWLPHETFARKIICYYELLPVLDNLMIVNKKSAILPHCDAIGLYANHIDMTKFLAGSSTNYQIVMQSMRSMYCLADDSMKVLLRHFPGPKLHGRLRNLPTTPDGCEEFIVSTKGSSEARKIGRLALVLEDQGHYKKAEEKFQRAVKLLIISTQCSPEARDLSQLALALEDQGLYKEAEEKFQRAVRLFGEQQSPGPVDVATLFCLNKLASMLRNRDQCKDAELYSRSCLTARIRISGIASDPTLLTADNLVLSMRCQGRHQDAYNLLRDALENADLTISDKVSHVKLLDTLAKLALDCEPSGVAEFLSCDVVRKSICLYGDKHPFTLNRMSDLAAILAWTGYMPGAEAISRHALDGLEQTLGTDHPYCLKAARRLADYIRFQQRYDDASLRLKQILKMQKMRIGNHHPDTLTTMRSLSAVYALRGYLKDAEVLLDQASSSQEKCFGLKHPYTSWTLRALTSVKELQKNRPLVEGEMQRELLELFGPKVRSTSESKYLGYVWSSPFQTSVESEVIRSVVDGDQESLRNILTEKKVDTHILGRALREAAASSQETFVRLLLDYAAPINDQSGFHGTALQAASFAGSKAVVELLLDGKAKVHQEGGIFGNAMRAAILGRHPAIVRLFLNCGLTGKVSQEVLNSSIQLALRTEDVQIISELLEAGADINTRDNLFGSLLQQVSFFGQKEIMTMLLEGKADIHMQAGIFGSPLQAAIVTQNKSATAQLLRAGANVRSSHDNSENNVLDEHRSGSETALATILLERFADSFQFIPLSNRVNSWGPLQSLPQPMMYSLESTTSQVKTNSHSDGLISIPTKPEKGPKFTPVSTAKRIFRFRSGSDKDSSVKSGSETHLFRKRSIQASKRLISIARNAS